MEFVFFVLFILLIILLVLLLVWYFQSLPTPPPVAAPTRSIATSSLKRDLNNIADNGGTQASNVPYSFLTFLGTLPSTLISYFTKNFSNIDLSNFGVPGTNGSTRGPLSNINIAGEVTGTVSVPVVGNVFYSVTNLTGLDQLTASTNNIVTFSAPNGVNPITSYWNYATGILHVNTTLTITIPSVTANITLNVPACSSVTATLKNVQIVVDLGLDYLPQLGVITKIAVEMNPLKYPASHTSGPVPPFSMSFGDSSFSCSFSPLSPLFNTLLNDVFSGRITAPVNNTVPGILLKYLNQGLSAYNNTINSFITSAGIVDSQFNVLITDLATVAQKFIGFLSGFGVNQGIIMQLQTELQLGLAALQMFFAWPGVTFGCQTAQYTLGTCNPFPYNTGSIQPNIEPYVGIYKTRSEAKVCADVQRFGCNEVGNSCVPVADGPFIWDPKSGDQTQLFNCSQNCINYACRIRDNACIPECQCQAYQGNDCYDYRTKSNVCDKKCPAYSLITSGPEAGFCIATLGGTFYNDPACGKGNTGVCIVEQINKMCYPNYPANDGFLAQGAAMTADACANLGVLLDTSPPTFIPGGSCTSTQCVGNSCVGSSVPCLPQPLGSNYLPVPWTPAYCLPNT